MADTVYLEITSANTTGLLEKLRAQGVVLCDIENIADLTVRIRCSYQDMNIVRQLTVKTGGSVKIVRTYGLKTMLHYVFHRPVIMFSFALLFFLVLFLPSRVLFIRIEGNSSIPSNKIIEAAERSGVCFGASRRYIRSESVKNALIGEIPELQWVGINTSGCVAIISVREKNADNGSDQITGIGSIVADRDGIIHSCTVLNGTSVCREGEAVVAGQTLVSGYTDCGIAIKAVRAQAEITACTLRNLTAVTSDSVLSRGEALHSETKYSLRLGKKLINFYKDSGISDTTCVKMYSEDYLTLPGGFQLPVALVTQQYIYYAVMPAEVSNPEEILEDYCEDYLITQMQAGQILSKRTTYSDDNGACTFSGDYICLEMIGQFVNEEIVTNDGKTD